VDIVVYVVAANLIVFCNFCCGQIANEVFKEVVQRVRCNQTEEQ